MKKSVYLLTSLAVVAVIGAIAQARITGTSPTGASADAFCVGSRTNEFCVDSSGNAIPTTTDDATLGTSSLEWNAAYIKTINIGTGGIPASLPVGTVGATNATGVGGTAATQLINSGIQVYGKIAITGIVTSTSIPVNSSYETLMSTANTTVNDLALPSISTSTVPGGSTELPSGTFLVLSSTGASGVIFTDEGTLTGTRLQLGAASRTVTQFKTLTLIYDATDHFWREISFGNN